MSYSAAMIGGIGKDQPHEMSKTIFSTILSSCVNILYYATNLLLAKLSSDLHYFVTSISSHGFMSRLLTQLHMYNIIIMMFYINFAWIYIVHVFTFPFLANSLFSTEKASLMSSMRAKAYPPVALLINELYISFGYSCLYMYFHCIKQYVQLKCIEYFSKLLCYKKTAM